MKTSTPKTERILLTYWIRLTLVMGNLVAAAAGLELLIRHVLLPWLGIN